MGRSELLETLDAELRTGSVLLVGEMGVGKTRLAREMAERWREQGGPVETAIASPAAASIPFGAVSHLVPDMPSDDLLLMLERTRRAVSSLGGRGRLLLVVDDVQYLDSGSVALLERLATTDTVSLLLTGRSDGRSPPTLAALTKDDLVRTIEVGPLDGDAVRSLIESRYGSRPEESLVASVWAMARGNPLFVEELLEGAESAAAIRDRGETVELAGSLTPSDRLTELVEHRFADLTAEERQAMETVAVVEPVAVELVATMIDPSVLDELVARRLLHVERLRANEVIRTAHPLYGEVIRSSMSGVRRGTVTAELADTLLAGDPIRPDLALTAAVWLFDAGREPAPEVAAAAGSEALAKGDPSLAERLALVALQDSESPATLVVVGTARSVQGDVQAARRALRRALEQAATDDERLMAATAYARHLGWRENAVDEAVDVLREAAVEMSSDEARSDLRVEEAALLARQGDLEQTLEVTGALLRDTQDDRIRVRALVWSTLMRVMLGRFDGLEGDLTEASEIATVEAPEGFLTLDQLGANRLMCSMFVDIHEARRLAIAGHAECLRHGGAPVIWSMCHTAVEALGGDVEGGVRLARRAIDEARVFDPFHNGPMARCLVSLMAAFAGDLATARSALSAAEALGPLEPRSRLWFDRADVWIAAWDRPGEIGERLEASVARAAEADLVVWAADLAFDAVRLGVPQVAHRHLESLAARTSGVPIIGLFADASAGVLDDDAGRVEETVREMVLRGARLPAAEVAAVVAQRMRGDDAGRFAAGAIDILSGCSGAASPVVSRIEDPLSDREREVARLAAAGHTSRDVAGALYLSRRTVDNHLARVYRKLGLSGRMELPDVFPVSVPMGEDALRRA